MLINLLAENANNTRRNAMYTYNNKDIQSPPSQVENKSMTNPVVKPFPHTHTPPFSRGSSPYKSFSDKDVTDAVCRKNNTG